MTAEVSGLFHWSPSRNRESIEREGLRTATSVDGSWTPPHICLSDTPSAALGLTNAEGPADLWFTYAADCVNLSRAADHEWRATSARCWYVATRSEGDVPPPEVTLTDDREMGGKSWGGDTGCSSAMTEATMRTCPLHGEDDWRAASDVCDDREVYK